METTGGAGPYTSLNPFKRGKVIINPLTGDVVEHHPHEDEHGNPLGQPLDWALVKEAYLNFLKASLKEAKEQWEAEQAAIREAKIQRAEARHAAGRVNRTQGTPKGSNPSQPKMKEIGEGS